MIELIRLKGLMLMKAMLIFQVNFRFQPKTCDGPHDFIQKAMSFNNVGIVFVKENDYRIHC